MAVTTPGLLHFISGGVGFLALIAACFVYAARFRGEGRSDWTLFSITALFRFAIRLARRSVS